MKADNARTAPELSALDPEQTRAAANLPLPRARLGRPALFALWILRVYAVAAVALVVYVFVKTLRG